RVLEEEAGVIFAPSSILYGENISRLLCNKRNEVLKIIDYLYSDANVFLFRKHALAMIFKDSKKDRITDSDVLEIRKLYSSGKYSQREIGELYGVSGSHVGFIVNKKVYKHVK